MKIKAKGWWSECYRVWIKGFMYVGYKVILWKENKEQEKMLTLPLLPRISLTLWHQGE